MAGSYVTVSAKIRRELKEEAERLGVDFSEVIRRAIEEEALRITLEHSVTVYDASYIAIAREHGLTLVTEDGELRGIAESYVEARSLDEL